MKLEILVTGRHGEIVQTVERLINKNPGWHATAAFTNDEAMQFLETVPVDILLLSSGIPEDEEAVLRRCVAEKKPAIILIQHYGGGSGLLANEITQAINTQQKQNA